MEVVARNSAANLHEDMLNSRLKSHILAERVLIVALANIFGPATLLTHPVVAAFPAKLIPVAEVFFTQSTHRLILLNGSGQVLVISLVPGLHCRFSLLGSVTGFV